MKVDYIIVGLGLAGTLLAHELIKLGNSVLVFDDPDQTKASDVAAGLINPIVFRRMTKSWLVDEAFPQMESTYLELENLLKAQFYFPGEIHRILADEDVSLWKEKANSNKLQKYLIANPDLSFKNQNINSPFGRGRITKAGRLDLQKLILLFSHFLQQKNILRKEKIDFKRLQVNDSGITYKEVTAEKIIFCEGAAVSHNPFFKSLKFKHSKGEILELHIPDLKTDEIISRNIFIMPVGDDRYKVGATYSWESLDWHTTPEAKAELLTKLKSITPTNPEIIKQKAGIRPTMHDRKPVIGFLPDFPQIGIFNGLGPKGVLLAPFLARQFAEFTSGILDYIHPEVNIGRYFRKK